MVLSLRADMVEESNGKQVEEDINFVDHLQRFENRKGQALTAVEIQGIELEHNEYVMNYFMYHQQSNSIEEYETSFLQLKCWAETWSNEIFTEDWVVSVFVRGLKEEIRKYVEWCSPNSLQRAIDLAKQQELCHATKVFDKSSQSNQTTNSNLSSAENDDAPEVIPITAKKMIKASLSGNVSMKGNDISLVHKKFFNSSFSLATEYPTRMDNERNLLESRLGLNGHIRRIYGAAPGDELYVEDKLFDKNPKRDKYIPALEPKPPDHYDTQVDMCMFGLSIISNEGVEFLNDSDKAYYGSTKYYGSYSNLVISVGKLEELIEDGTNFMDLFNNKFDEITKKDENSWKSDLKENILYWGERGKFVSIMLVPYLLNNGGWAALLYTEDEVIEQLSNSDTVGQELNIKELGLLARCVEEEKYYEVVDKSHGLLTQNFVMLELCSTVKKLFTNLLLDSCQDELSFRTLARELHTNRLILLIVLVNTNSRYCAGNCSGTKVQFYDCSKVNQCQLKQLISCMVIGKYLIDFFIEATFSGYVKMPIHKFLGFRYDPGRENVSHLYWSVYTQISDGIFFKWEFIDIIMAFAREAMYPTKEDLRFRDEVSKHIVGSSRTAIRSKLSMRSLSFGVSLWLAHDDGSVLNPEVLELTKEVIMAKCVNFLVMALLCLTNVTKIVSNFINLKVVDFEGVRLHYESGILSKLSVWLICLPDIVLNGDKPSKLIFKGEDADYLEDKVVVTSWGNDAENVLSMRPQKNALSTFDMAENIVQIFKVGDYEMVGLIVDSSNTCENRQQDLFVHELLQHKNNPVLPLQFFYWVKSIYGQWLCSIILNIQPWESVRRGWDVFLYEANRVVIFQATLAIMEFYFPAFVKTKGVEVQTMGHLDYYITGTTRFHLKFSAIPTYLLRRAAYLNIAKTFGKLSSMQKKTAEEVGKFLSRFLRPYLMNYGGWAGLLYVQNEEENWQLDSNDTIKELGATCKSSNSVDVSLGTNGAKLKYNIEMFVAPKNYTSCQASKEDVYAEFSLLLVSAHLIELNKTIKVANVLIAVLHIFHLKVKVDFEEHGIVTDYIFEITIKLNERLGLILLGVFNQWVGLISTFSVLLYNSIIVKKWASNEMN